MWKETYWSEQEAEQAEAEGTTKNEGCCMRERLSTISAAVGLSLASCVDVSVRNSK
jgi:hypothetical protein